MSEPIATPEESEPDDETPSRKMDAELRQLSAMLRMLAEMEPPARSRVVAYLASRFQE